MNKLGNRKAENSRKVEYFTVTDDYADQRIDNFLINRLKGVPKSRIYRILRKGEVRVNKKRIVASYRLNLGDIVRLPPVFLAEKAESVPPSKDTIQLLNDRILYEDEFLLILNKPVGMSVHAGSTVRVGIVEALRHAYPKLDLELAHRLDADTSGCLVLAKKKRILRELHSLFREGMVKKKYMALTKGWWKKAECHVDLPLQKDFQTKERQVVEVKRSGKEALTVFHPKKRFHQASLVEVELFTGRTHQIRVHAQSQGHPIAGDDRYGDPEFNKLARKLGLKRMFLHASSVEFVLPSLNQHIKVEAPLDDDLVQGINAFEELQKNEQE